MRLYGFDKEIAELKALIPVKKIIKHNHLKTATNQTEFDDPSSEDSDEWMDFVFNEDTFENEIKDINEMLSQTKFIKQQKEGQNSKLSQESLNDISKAILLEEYKKDSMIFDFGDFGDKFFIILKGEVSILIPVQRPVPVDEQERRKVEYDGHKEKIKTKNKKIKMYKESIKKITELKEKHIVHLVEEVSESSLSSNSCITDKELVDDLEDNMNRRLSQTQGFLDLQYNITKEIQSTITSVNKEKSTSSLKRRKTKINIEQGLTKTQTITQKQQRSSIYQTNNVVIRSEGELSSDPDKSSTLDKH